MLFRSASAFVLFFAVFFYCVGSKVLAEEVSTVKLPRSDYDKLIAITQNPRSEKRPVATPYALAKAAIQADIKESRDAAIATLSLNLEFAVFENEWTAVPILPAGTSVVHAEIDGTSAQLSSTPQGVFWNTNKAGNYVLTAEFRVDALRSETGYTVIVPTPQAASITVDGNIPKSAIEPVVLPSAGTTISAIDGESIRIVSTVPSSSGFQISWKTPLNRGFAMSRAEYKGVLQPNEEVITWTGKLSVELFGKESVVIPLFPKNATISDIRVDEKSSSLLVEADRFVTKIRGEGSHIINVEFQTPIGRESGSPSVELFVPAVPISRFDLRMPERKEFSVEPFTNVSYHEEKDAVTATIFAPMSEALTLTWTEAVPDEIKEEVRENATYIHTAYAEEGVLYVQANASYDITRGETSLLEFEVPKGIQINRINAPGFPLADWRMSSDSETGANTVQVFFEQKLSGTVSFVVDYDMSLGALQADASISLPLVRAKNVHRQRGMVALLSGRDLSLKPVDESGLTRVGENQLPAEIRSQTERTISHTFKYGETVSALNVQITKPERKDGKFDAVVHTLVSLSDVTLTAAANLEINVKTGGIEELQIELPGNINILGLSAPSLRTHRVTNEGEKQIVDVQFTQVMEGQFRIELTYEKILPVQEPDIQTPTALVRAAEIQQGTIAVEARSAVEVQASNISNLSGVDPAELPQQLLLKTTNPILLAFSYVRSDPAPQLSLKLTRHDEVEVQSAAIDSAQYTTLYTSDGLLVTTAKFMVRNNRQQFLRINLPAGSKVWSAAVDNKAEKPALAQPAASSSDPEVLIKIINSAQPFPVELVYQTERPKAGIFGSIVAELPRPDMVVTDSLWHVYLPPELRYGVPSSNLRSLDGRGPSTLPGNIPVQAPVAGNAGHPFRILVPADGIRFSFQKLYANQTREAAYIRVPYESTAGFFLLSAVVFFSTMLIWYPFLGGLEKGTKFIVSGTALLFAITPILRQGVGLHAAVAASLLTGVAVFLPMFLKRGAARRSKPETTQP